MSDLTFISVFNEGCIELAKNHLESLKRAGIGNYIAYVTDVESYNTLINNYNVIYLSNSQITNDKKDFNSEDFNKLSYLRYYVIQKYIESGRPVWYMDVDTVVLKNLNKKYVELLEAYKDYQVDALFQSDINSICTGCMCLFPTENTKRLVETIIKEKLRNANDQMLLNHLVNEKQCPLSFALLEYTEFPIGYLYFNNEYVVSVGESLNKIIEKKNEYDSVPEKDIHFVHANWIIGNENKIKSLKQYNLWFVSECNIKGNTII